MTRLSASYINSAAPLSFYDKLKKTILSAFSSRLTSLSAASCTDDGRVLKAVNMASGAAEPTASPLMVEELAVFPSAATITNLLVSRQPGQPPRLIVVTDDEIRAVPLARCASGRVGHCSACVRLRDPYCAWDEVERRCRPLADWPSGVEPLQNVTGGYHPRCPRGERGGVVERGEGVCGDVWR